MSDQFVDWLNNMYQPFPLAVLLNHTEALYNSYQNKPNLIISVWMDEDLGYSYDLVTDVNTFADALEYRPFQTRESSVAFLWPDNYVDYFQVKYGIVTCKHIPRRDYDG